LPPHRLLHTESFRLAAVFALLYLSFAIVLMIAVYWIVAHAQRSALLDSVSADIGTIQNGYRGEGISEAIEVIEQRLGPAARAGGAQPDEYIILQDATGRPLAGNLPPQPRTLGVALLVPAAANPGTASDTPGSYPRLLGQGVLIGDGAYLFVGRDMQIMAAVKTRLLQAFAWITLGAVAMAFLGGILSSLRYMKRIDEIARTCHAIMEGRYSERIALGGSGDELDRLGNAINRMLDRIAALMENLRQVSSDIAHDLRTPLTRLRYRLERAQASRTVEEYAQEISGAVEDADQTLSIFSALLRISQIESNAQARAMAEYSLSNQLRKLIEIYLPVAEDEGHTLSADIASNIRIHGDQELLLQLFVNLLENAIRHTGPAIPVHVTLERVDRMVRVAISDHGAGIPEAEREKVLRRFYRLSSSRSTPGTGLGLALVNAIPQLHEAELRLLHNQPGLRVELMLRGL